MLAVGWSFLVFATVGVVAFAAPFFVVVVEVFKVDRVLGDLVTVPATAVAAAAADDESTADFGLGRVDFASTDGFFVALEAAAKHKESSQSVNTNRLSSSTIRTRKRTK